jgi:hypothetical protein
MGRSARWAAVLAAAVLIVGCHKPQTGGGAGKQPAMQATQMSESQVMDAARKSATEAKKELAGYKASLPYYDPAKQTWYVYFEHVPNRYPGDHFSVFVDDRTGKARYFGGQ